MDEEKEVDSKEKKETEEKKEENKGQEPRKQGFLGIKKKQNRQILLAVILMVSILLIILAVPFVRKNFIDKFEYINLDFFKAKSGGITFYTTKIPLVNSYGFPIGDYSMYFRNEPSELEDIEVNIIEKKIAFEKGGVTYISIESEAPICDDNIVAVVGLTNFLNKFGNLEVKGAMNDAIYTSSNDLEYVTCGTHPDNTVLLIKTGNETIIEKTGENCYELIYKDCEINRVAEKFMLTILEGYMKTYEELYG
jgi:hypothetical protein